MQVNLWTWEDLAKHIGPMVLFNNYPEIVGKCEAWDEMPNWTDPNGEEEADEVLQWYIVGDGGADVDWVNRHFKTEIFWSELCGAYILPVFHWGTCWDGVNAPFYGTKKECERFKENFGKESK